MEEELKKLPFKFPIPKPQECIPIGPKVMLEVVSELNKVVLNIWLYTA